MRCPFQTSSTDIIRSAAIKNGRALPDQGWHLCLNTAHKAADFLPPFWRQERNKALKWSLVWFRVVHSKTYTLLYIPNISVIGIYNENLSHNDGCLLCYSLLKYNLVLLFEFLKTEVSASSSCHIKLLCVHYWNVILSFGLLIWKSMSKRVRKLKLKCANIWLVYAPCPTKKN